MSTKMNVPELRFGEFSGEWEERILGDIFGIFQGYAFSSNDSVDKGAKWVKIADVGIQKMKVDTPSYLPNTFLEKYKKFTLKKGDYVIALTRPILNDKLKISLIDDMYDNSLLNQRVGKLITKNSHTFVYCMLQGHSLIHKIDNSILGSEPPNLSTEQIKHIRTFIPSKPEQEKIASFLSSVDSKIEQLSKKKTLLKQYKKGAMQKIFSQTLRFKDDDGSEFPEWVEKEFREFGKFYYGKGIPKTVVVPDGKNPCIRYGELYSTHNEFVKEIKSFTNLDSNSMKLSKGGEVLIPRVGEKALDFAKASFLPFKDVGIGEMISVFETKENGLYLSYFINSMLINSFAKVVEGGSVSNLYFRYLEKISISLPSLKEQTKIANFLSSLDKQIELTDKELNATKEFKKALLQKMFV